MWVVSVRVRASLALLATVGAATAGGAIGARAQTAPVVAPAPPVAPNLLEQIVVGLLAPAPAPAAPVAAPVPVPAAPTKVIAPARTAPAAARVVAAKPGVRPVSGPRSGPRTTTGLLEALRSLGAVGIAPSEATALGMGGFPVGGVARYRDDWMEPRFTPNPHPHMGNDIFAARGTPVRAPSDGVVKFTNEATGGKSAYVTTGDKTFYYMTHLDGFNKRLRSGQRVKQGDLVGYVGSSGNASGDAPHVHFEIHPRGGAAVNPKPFLDAWLSEAEAGVPILLAARSAVVAPPAASPAGPAAVTAPAPTLADSVTALAAALLLPLTPGPIGTMVVG